MASEWVPALLGGLTLAGHTGLVSASDITCAFYGNVFRRPGRFLGGEDLDALDPDDFQDPAERELLDQWWNEAARTDRGVVPPGARTLGGVGVQAALAAMANSRFLAEVSERLLLLWLKQVRGYFTQPEIRQAIQDRFAAAIDNDTRVVVAHSLGSVVAYEVLAAHPHWNVRSLITLGSPLGIRNVVLDRLLPRPERTGAAVRGRWPGGVTRWTNIADRRDFVALVKKLHGVFGPEVVDIEISNGVQMHQVINYLTAGETGDALAHALKPDHRF